MTQRHSQKKVPIVVGPTGVGKTEVALKLAEILGAEIVSADSRQIYRYLDIGTDKPPRSARERIPHHFIDILDPDEEYNAGFYSRDARRIIDEIFARGRLPLVVGGSGLYIRALVDGFYDAEVRDATIKKSLLERAQREGAPRLYAELAAVDPETAARLHPNDTQRITRALEVFSITGRPFSALAKQGNVPAEFQPVFVGLVRDRAELYAQIEARVDVMLSRGLVAEVQRLQEMGYGPELNALQTVGYREVFRYLAGELSESEMVAEIKKNSRRYAKRQLTWFRRDTRIVWFDLTGEKDLSEIVDQITSVLRERGVTF
jgi:tRNA dimethylallyltransferase